MIVIGVDIGQAHDSAAVVVLAPYDGRRIDGHRPVWDVASARTLPLGTSYGEVVHVIDTVSGDFAAAGYPVVMVVDATGVGRPVLEQVRARTNERASVVGVTSTGGRRPGGRWPNLTAPKEMILDALRIALQQRGIHALWEHPALARQVESLRRKPSGRVEAAGSGHDDLALALAYAVWLGDTITDMYVHGRIAG